jgi:hypothetical protein
MAKFFKKAVPLNAEGLTFNRPREQSLWRVLTNVVLTDGFIQSRPGLKPVGPMSQDITTHQPGIITAIGEARQWVNENSSIGSCEALQPNATTSNTGWTAVGAATIHAATDDTVPDNGTTKATATADGSTYIAGFTNLVGTYDFIDSATLHIRARATTPLRQILEVEHGNGFGNLGVIGSIDLTNTAYTGDTSGSGFMDFFIPIPTDFQGFVWSTSEVNNATFKLTLNKDTNPGLTFLLPSTTGSDNGFSPAGDAWKRAGIDDPNAPIVFFADRQTTSVGEPGERISIKFDNLAALTSVSKVRVRFAVARQEGGLGRIDLYQVGNDAVRRTIASAQSVDLIVPDANNSNFWSPFVGIDIVEVELTTNPETGLAWTVVDLQSDPEFGILVNTGSANIVFTSAELIVEGNLASTGAEIDLVELYVCGRALSGASAGETAQKFLGRIMATARAFYRLNEQNTNQGFDLVDILGAVAAPTASPYNWDMTQFFDRLYFENSINTTYYYSGATIAILTAPLPLGHTIWTFGNRLMKGDIISAGVRSIKRVAWSALAAPDDWTGAGSGTADLTHGGEGRLRKGLPLASHVAALYLDRGIYNFRWTGDDASPFVPKMQDPDTGIVAPNSCIATLDADGVSSHIFLGRGPKGVDIFLYDGTAAHPIGGEIILELLRLANPETLERAFAVLEPEFNLYLLFVAEGTDLFPEMCWVFDITSGQWVRWDLPFAVSAAGYWTLVDVPGGAALPSLTSTDGVRTLILGTTLGIPYQLDYDISSDRLNVSGNQVSGYLDSAHESETRLAPVEYTLETGAVILENPEGPKDVVQLSAVHRVWLTYEDRGQCDITVEISNDGGKSYNTAVSHTIGTDGPSITPSEELRETVVSILEPKEGRHHSIRISSAAGEDEARQKIKLSKLVIEYEVLGELP